MACAFLLAAYRPRGSGGKTRATDGRSECQHGESPEAHPTRITLVIAHVPDSSRAGCPSSSHGSAVAPEPAGVDTPGHDALGVNADHGLRLLDSLGTPADLYSPWPPRLCGGEIVHDEGGTTRNAQCRGTSWSSSGRARGCPWCRAVGCGRSFRQARRAGFRPGPRSRGAREGRSRGTRSRSW